MTFDELMQAVREAHREPGERPPSMTTIANMAGLSRQYLWCLSRGTRTAPPWTEEALAKAWGVSTRKVRSALKRSRQLAE